LRFLDANVFIYAFYMPTRKLNADKDKKAMKDGSKRIIRRINDGIEEVTTTVVHLSEVSNILKRALPLEDVVSILITLYSLDNVKILDVTKEDYFGAMELAEETGLDPNDSLAVQVIRIKNIDEIYSFDEGFDRVKGIKRVFS
jgi:Predicted nucleic acid-binding protein, contains PIN domain